MLVQTASGSSQTAPPVVARTASSTQPAPAARPSADADSAELLKVKRIYVDSFGDDPVSQSTQSAVVSELVESKRLKVTENRERADATLKGIALEKRSQELHSYAEGTAVGQGAISDSSAHTQTVDEARVSLRLVNPDGDVIWTSTQESKGAKYKGATADVAEKCIRQLLHDVEKLEHASASQGTAAPVTTAPNAEHH